MPNHISNRLSFVSPDDEEIGYKIVKEVEALMRTEKHDFDFNVLLPYPEHWAKLDEAHHIAFEAAMNAQSEEYDWSSIPKDGYNQGGYEWCCNTWGTKWNAYEVAYGWDDVFFQTAWSTPLPIWEALSKRFPDVELVIEYADEDRGSNCGILRYSNGELFSRVNEKDLESEFADPVLFARAIINEQHAHSTQVELNNAQKRIKELEQQIAEKGVENVSND